MASQAVEEENGFLIRGPQGQRRVGKIRREARAVEDVAAFSRAHLLNAGTTSQGIEGQSEKAIRGSAKRTQTRPGKGPNSL